MRKSHTLLRRSDDWVAKDSLENNMYTYRINLCREVLYKGNSDFTVPPNTGIHQQRRDALTRQHVVGMVGFPSVVGTSRFRGLDATPAHARPRCRLIPRCWASAAVGATADGVLYVSFENGEYCEHAQMNRSARITFACLEDSTDLVRGGRMRRQPYKGWAPLTASWTRDMSPAPHAPGHARTDVRHGRRVLLRVHVGLERGLPYQDADGRRDLFDCVRAGRSSAGGVGVAWAGREREREAEASLPRQVSHARAAVGQCTSPRLRWLCRLACLIAAYFIFGLLYRRFVVGATGWKQCPNYDLWRAVFGALSVRRTRRRAPTLPSCSHGLPPPGPGWRCGRTQCCGRDKVVHYRPIPRGVNQEHSDLLDDDLNDEEFDDDAIEAGDAPPANDAA